MAAETEAGFEIEEANYPVPVLFDMDMDELQIVYDYSKLTLEDFVFDDEATEEDLDGLIEKVKNPAFVRALLHVAYRRGNPKIAEAKVKQIVGKVNAAQAIATFLSTIPDGDDVVPPASTTELEKPSGSGSVESSEPSGAGSMNGSDLQVVQPVSIGTGRSATSSREPTAGMWGS